MSDLKVCGLCGTEVPIELRNQIIKDDIGIKIFPVNGFGWSPYYVGSNVFLECPECTEFEENTKQLDGDKKILAWLDHIGLAHEVYINDDNEEVIRILGKK